MKKIPRILLAAVSSNSGKTAAACGMMSAYVQQGLNIRSCKCGPDYIDPMFHREVLGVDSENLDLFFSDAEELTKNFIRHTERADLVIAEGVMGYYDGMGLDTVRGSSYEIASVLKFPVILVVNARGAAMTLAAVLKGMTEYVPESRICGVILNQISGMLYPRMKQMLEQTLQRMNHSEIKIVGYLPKADPFVLESRHLGLVTPQELQGLKLQMQQAGEIANETLDLEGIREIAERAEELKWQQEDLKWQQRDACFLKSSFSADQAESGEKRKKRIAVARDEAFCFYYKENLEILESMGCELICFSPLRDKQLPDGIEGMIFGGGYPELYAQQLSENRSMLMSVRAALEKQIPCLAECGGFMYLHEKIRDREGKEWSMVGRIRGISYPTGKLVRFGYVNVIPMSETCKKEWLPEGTSLRGHEFHYWDSTENGEDCMAVKPDGKRSWSCIHAEPGLFAGYPHLYYPSNRAWIENFLKCR